MEKSKKNNKRLGIVLVALMMIVAIGATAGYTLARYITTGSQSAQATVAKWGVTITATGSDEIFGSMYKNAEIKKTEENDLSVKATATVVAPGTKGSVEFTINGQPDVKSQLLIALGNDFSVAYLEYEKGKYYYPMKWTVGTENTVTVSNEETLDPAAYVAELKTALTNAVKTELGGSDTFAAGATLTGKKVKISWEWALYTETGSESAKTEDAKINEYDTILGNLASSATFYDANDTYKDKYGSTAAEATKLAYGKDVKVDFTLTLQQIQ